MKVEYWLFSGGVLFFLPLGITYGIVPSWQEPVGTTSLFLTSGLALLIGLYLFVVSRRVDARPEDDPRGTIEQGAGELGEFAPYSWWPLPLAFGGALIFFGMAAGYWVSLVGAAFGAVALIGWVYEFYRGEHAH